MRFLSIQMIQKLKSNIVIIVLIVLGIGGQNCSVLNSKQTVDNTISKSSSPTFFDVKVNDSMYENAEVIKPWKTIKLDPEFAGSWIVSGDVDNDGEPEIVSARNFDIRDNHHTTSVIVYNLDGSVLWKWGDEKSGRNELHHDVACQIYDWDENGTNDVIIATDKYLIELDGTSGKEKRKIEIPTGASDCIVFANISGKKRATDVLIKNRYGKIWAINSNGKNLWDIELPAGKKTAHQPVPMDIDEDGKDEIMAGYAMLNPDGSIKWDILDSNIKFRNGHLDCAEEIITADGTNGIAITCCGDNTFALLNRQGKVMWKMEGNHFESIDIGKVFSEVPGKQIVVDIDHQPRGKSPLLILSDKGELLGRIVTNSSRHHMLVDWNGEGQQNIVIASTAAMFNSKGEMEARFDIPDYTNKSFICSKGDMTGDGVPDIIFSTDPGKEVYIFKNLRSKTENDNLQLGTKVNYSLY